MRLLSIDSETEPITPACRTPRLVCVSASIDGEKAQIIPWHTASAFLAESFRAAIDGRIALTGHNLAGFDLPVFANHDPSLLPLIFGALDAGRIYDTEILSKLYDRSRGFLRQVEVDAEDDSTVERKNGYSLDNLSQRFLRRTLDKSGEGWRLRFGELRDVPVAEWPERARAYAMDDAIVAWLVHRALWLEGRKLADDLYCTATEESRAAFALGLMTGHGIGTSPDRILSLVDTYAAKLTTARDVAVAAGFIRDANARANGARARTRDGHDKPADWTKSTKAIRARVVDAFTAMGLPVPLSDSGKNIATAAQYLRQSRDPGLKAIADYNRAEKILTTFVPVLMRGMEHPIHAGFDSVLETGRTSTFDPNLQNISKAPGVRECFVPRPGHYFCSVDFNAAELRSWGQASLRIVGFSRMAETFQRNPHADPHLRFAANKLLGISLEEAIARKKAKDPAIAKARHRAKAANFGFPGGMGAQRFRDNEEGKYWESDGMDGLLIDLDGAKALRAAWLGEWEEANPYFKFAAHVADGGGVFRGIISGAYRGGCGYSDGANNAFQENTAFGAKRALYAVAKACYLPSPSPLYGSRIVIFAHDEVIAEHPIDRAHEAAQEQTRLMVDAFQTVHPDVPVTAEPALMEYWSKNAEANYNPAGRLIPWVEERKAA